MASMTMTASCLGNSNLTRNGSKRVILAKASSTPTIEGEQKANLEMKKKEESINGRRGLVISAAIVAVSSIGKVAMADEPKRGSPEAKAKYAPICVTMPTARICRN